ncbi:MAG: PEP-CTERM sorting domain-containing protein [Pirellulales bacterium]
MRKVVLAVCVVVSLLSVASAANAATWNANADFSTSANPNGAWSYGWAKDTAFKPYLYATNLLGLAEGGINAWRQSPNGPTEPMLFKNTYSWAQNGVQQGQLSLHPGSDGGASIVRWTAPDGLTGRINLLGEFLPGDDRPMRVGVFQNAAYSSSRPLSPSLWIANDAGFFDLDVSVSAGDTIDFAVYGGYAWGNTPLEATITVSPALTPGDVDMNGQVDIFDVAVLQTKYGMTSGATWADGDFDDNGTVDIFDVAAMQVNYGYGVASAPAPVPEPSTLVLGVLGAIGITLGRRRWRKAL